MSDEELDQIVTALQEHPFGVMTQEGFKELTDTVQKWLTRGLWAFGIIGVMCTIAMVGFGLVLVEFQQQRLDFCQQQNKRHDNTLSEFDKVAAETIAKHPELKGQIEESKDANKRLINAIAPKFDCEKLKGGFLPL